MANPSATNTTPVTTTSAPAITMVRRTIEKFDGTDYAIWAMHMRNILTECGLVEYLNDQQQIENYDAAIDRRALAEILFTLSNSQARLVINATTAKGAWDTLKSHHLHSSSANRLHLKTQLLGIKKTDKETIREYVGRVDDLTNQINSLATNDAERIQDEDKALVF